MYNVLTPQQQQAAIELFYRARAERHTTARAMHAAANRLGPPALNHLRKLNRAGLLKNRPERADYPDPARRFTYSIKGAIITIHETTDLDATMNARQAFDAALEEVAAMPPLAQPRCTVVYLDGSTKGLSL